MHVLLILNYLKSQFTIKKYPIFIININQKKDGESICTNLTSFNNINVENESLGIESIELKYGFAPNVKNQDKFNYFTPVYVVKNEDIYKHELTENENMRMNEFSEKAAMYVANEFKKNLYINEYGDLKKHSEYEKVEEAVNQDCNLKIVSNQLEEFKKLNPNKSEEDYNELFFKYMSSSISSDDFCFYSDSEIN